MLEFDLEKIRDTIKNASETTKIYIGCDSERFRKKGVWWSQYATVVVLHLDGNHGCMIFGKTEVERDLDSNKNKPILRMMNEVYRASNLYLELEDVLKDRDVQIHLDINPDEAFGSNVAYNQAIGYVKGVCHITPVLKPDSFASSKAADRFAGIGEKIV